MSTLLVTRHPGAVEWARSKGIAFDEVIEHLDITRVGQGDVVIGSLPVHLVAGVCGRGARYFHVVLELPWQLRGVELTPEHLEKHGARLEEFIVTRTTGSPSEPPGKLS